MPTTTDIDAAIAEITHVTGQGSGEPCWFYGQMNWADYPAFDFTVTRGKEWKQVKLMADQVRRYQDGEGSMFFLIEMPAYMAVILEIEHLMLTVGELAWLRRTIDTTRPH